VLVIGGLGANFVAQKSAEVYNPDSNTWSTVAPPPGPGRFGHVTSIFGGKMLLAGGKASSPDVAQTLSTGIYDPVNDSWASGPPTLTTHYLGTAITFNGRVLLAGGDSGLNAVELLNPGDISWTPLAPLFTGREGHVVIPIPVAGLLFAGGSDGAGTVLSGPGSAELWNNLPSPPQWPSDSILTVTPASPTSVTLTWTPATDSGDITYEVHENGQLINSVPGSTLSTTVTNLPPGGTFTFAIQAVNSIAPTWNGPTKQLTLPTFTPTPRTLTAATSVAQPAWETTLTPQMGETRSAFSVGADGQANVSVPIWTPEGPMGMQPNLSFVYNSGAGRPGTMGVGWTLSGFPLSAITRCKSTLGVDAENGPVDFSGAIYCLDGERLIPVRVSSNLEFRAEHNDFKRITFTGSVTAPTGFTVQYKAGLVATFGTTDNSRLTGSRANGPQGDSVTYGWFLDKVSDRTSALGSGFKDNGEIVSYNKLTRTNPRYPNITFYESVLASIQYGFGGADIAPQNAHRRVDFTYSQDTIVDKERTDATYGFVTGMPLAHTERLTRVDVYGPNPGAVGKLKSYVLSYSTGATSGLQRLDSIAECDQFNLCKKPVSFTYEPGSMSFKEYVFDSQNAATDSPPFIADLNGDGKDDLYFNVLSNPVPGIQGYAVNKMLVSTNTSAHDGVLQVTNHIDVGPGIVNGNMTDMPILTEATDVFMAGVPNGHLKRVFSVDNSNLGNTPQEAISIQAGKTKTFRWDWGGLNDASWPTNYPNNTQPISQINIADLDGDGLPEEIAAEYVQGAGPLNAKWKFRMNTGAAITPFGDEQDTGVALPSQVIVGVDPGTAYVFNLDNSGRQAISFLVDTGTAGHIQGTNLMATHAGGAVISTGLQFDLQYQPYLLDVNGDGLTDSLELITYNTPGAGILLWNDGSGGVFRGSGSQGTEDDGTHQYWLNNLVTQTGVSGGVGFLYQNNGVLTADFNEDGLGDAALIGSNSGDGTSLRIEAKLLLGTKGATSPYVMRASPPLRTIDGSPIPLAFKDSRRGYGWVKVGDFNGDGLPDIVEIPGNDSSHIHFFIHQGAKAELLNGIVSSLGSRTTISYAPLSDPTVHTPATNCTTPLYCLTRGPWLVSDYIVDSDQGQADATAGRISLETSVSYYGGRADLIRGFLGFEQQMFLNGTTGQMRVLRFDNTSRLSTSIGSPYPFIFTPTDALDYVQTPGDLSGSGIHQTLHHVDYASRTFTGDGSPAPTGYSVVPSSASDAEMLLATAHSATLPYNLSASVQTTLQRRSTTFRGADGTLSYDVYDNPLGSTTTVVDKNSTTYTTVRRYTQANDPQNWLIGQVQDKTITSTVTQHGSGGIPFPFDSASRKTKFTYYPNTTLPNTVTVQPDSDDDSVKSTTTVRRDLNGHGLPTSISMDAAATNDDPLGGGTPLSRQALITYDTAADGIYPASITYGGAPPLPNGDHKIGFAYHNGLGVLAELLSENNQETDYTYDGFGRPTNVHRAVGPDTTVRYENSSAGDPAGVVYRTHVAQSGGQDVTTKLNYNGRMRQRSLKNGDGSFSGYETTYTGIPGQVFSDGGAVRDSDPVPTPTKYLYDEMGRVKYVTLPDNNTYSYSYEPTNAGVDLPGLIVVVTDARQKAHRTEIDPNGHTIQSIEQIPNTTPTLTDYVYGAFDTLVDVNAGTNGTVSLVYDSLGRRTTIRDFDLGIRTNAYNAFGAIVKEKSVDGNGSPASLAYKYDALGRLTERLSTINGEKTVYTWDIAPNGIGLLARDSFSSGTNVRWNGTVTRNYSYDSFGRLVQSIWSMDKPETCPACVNDYRDAAFTYGYAYDATSGLLNEIDYPILTKSADTAKVSTVFDFDQTGQIKNVYGRSCHALNCTLPNTNSITYWTATQRNAANQITIEDWAPDRSGNRDHTVTSYDKDRLWVTDSVTTNPGSGTVEHWAYPSHDGDGNLTSRENRLASPIITETFNYHQLLDMLNNWGAQKNGSTIASQSYLPDGYGRLTNGGNGSYDYAVPASWPRWGDIAGKEVGPSQLLHAVETITANATVKPMSYDRRGNQIRTFGGTTLQYDTSFGLPTNVGTGGNDRIWYDADLKRLYRQRIAEQDYNIFYVGDLFEQRENAGTTDFVFYIPSPRGIIGQVMWVDNGATFAPMATLLFHKDHLGSITSIENTGDGSHVNFNYDPWGNRIDPNNPLTKKPAYTLPTGGENASISPTVRLGFTGHEHDEDSGLINMRGRMYDPAIARFLSPDPMQQLPFHGLGYDRYAYVLNNPLRYTDPSGYSFLGDLFDSIGGLIGGGGNSGGMGIPSTSNDKEKGNNVGASSLPGSGGVLTPEVIVDLTNSGVTYSGVTYGTAPSSGDAPSGTVVSDLGIPSFSADSAAGQYSTPASAKVPVQGNQLGMLPPGFGRTCQPLCIMPAPLPLAAPEAAATGLTSRLLTWLSRIFGRGGTAAAEAAAGTATEAGESAAAEVGAEAAKALSSAENAGLRALFGRGPQGAQAVLQQLAEGETFALPEGVSRATLETYQQIAQSAIDRGIDTQGTQALRLQIIEQLLK
jgi:RHS repeat-associated protein